jgi:hypothetical protein
MTHLEKHITAVRNKLFINLLINALAWGAMALAATALLMVVIDRLFALPLPPSWRWPVLFGALGIWFSAAFFAAYIRRPSQQAAAVAIDAKLCLKERFSTALFAAASTEPFAMAAVNDAQETARQVNLTKQFPLRLSGQWRPVAFLLTLTLSAAFLLPRFDLFSRNPKLASANQDIAAQQSARADINHALAVVSSAPQWRNEDELGRLIDELRILANAPTLKDPQAASRKARRAIDLTEQVPSQATPEHHAGDAASQTGKFNNSDEQNARPSSANLDTRSDPKSATQQSGRSTIAGDRIANRDFNPNNPNKPGTHPSQPNPAQTGAQANANNAAGNNTPGNNAGKNPAANNNAPGPAQGKGQAQNNNLPGQAAPGDRPKQTAPFAVVPQHSSSQDQKDGKILARDLIASNSEPGHQRMTLAETARVLQEQDPDEINAEHVSGPAQSAAHKYFRTGDAQTP